MGIRGLSGYLKWKVASARKSVSLECYRGQRWAIDTSCILYRARASNLNPVTVVASLLKRLRDAQITPIFIFDGKPPQVKSELLDQRREQREMTQREIAALELILDTSANMTQMDKAMTERKVAELKTHIPQVTAGDKDHIKQLLYGSGVLFVSAMGEADDLLGYLARSGYVQAVLSTDMDMLARGIEVLIVPDTPDTMVMTAICLSQILQTLHITYAQFVDACVLMGTDYTGRDFKTTAPPEAISIARAGVEWKEEACLEAVRMLHGTGKIETLLSPAQFARFIAGPPPKEPDTVAKMAAEYGWPPSWI